MMVEAIERNGLRLGYLFDDLLTLYRIETRRRDLPRERLAVRQVIAETARSMLDRAERSGVRLSTACEDGLVVWSNREALDTILSNLVSNACKYTPRGGRVLLRARSEGTGVTIDVVDTGIGIARQHHDRIFERFYRVDDGRARAVGGTGLGLAIAKHYAQAVGATISLRSEENHGSTFSVHITETGPATGAVGRVWEDQ
jgi:two-component system phosphate regulon sensor histidine kinase PhoR